MSNILFISGIDTDAGKTYATAWLAKRFIATGQTVVTQKFIQTGNHDFSEDITRHRELMGISPLPEDLNHTTAPIIFSYPASAQLAAELDGKEIDLTIVDKSTEILASRYDNVLIEGAGGLMVPITDDFLTIDYISSRKLPVALVTNSKLGSINHTILSLEALKSRNITVKYVLYSTHLDADATISADTKRYVKQYLAKHFPETELLFVPKMM